MKMQSLRAGAAALVVAALTACTQPLDTVIPSNQAEWDKTLAPVIKKLDERDRQLFAAYMARHMMGAALGAAFGGKSVDAAIPIGTTIAQAISEQKTWMAEQAKAEAERARKEAEAAALKKEAQAKADVLRQQLSDAVTVALLAKPFAPANPAANQYSDRQLFKIAVKNTSDKTIAGVAGQLTFVDMFGKDVGAVGFKVTESIAAGSSYIWSGERKYNQFLPAHRAVHDLEEGKYTTRFEPEALVFSDGTSIKVDE